MGAEAGGLTANILLPRFTQSFQHILSNIDAFRQHAAIRQGEYFFLSPDEFRQKIQNGEFLEYEEVYQDRFYGTLKEQVERQLETGQNVVFDVDVKGGCNIKEFYGDLAMSLFIQPPSIEELRRRLINRGTDEMEQIEKRIAKAEYELSFAPRFDHIVVNDILEDAEAEALRLVNEFLEK